MTDSEELSVSHLLAMTPVFNGRDIVRLAARHLLLSYVKNRPIVRDVFFQTHQSDDEYEEHIESDWFDFDSFAWLYACSAICEAKDPYGMGAVLKRQTLEGALREMYVGPDWKRLGFALYTLVLPCLMKDPCHHIPLKVYMDDTRTRWGAELLAEVRKEGFSVRRPEVNLLFIKLHLLDPTLVISAFDHLRQAMPDLHMEMVTTNYLGPPLETSLIARDVTRAINVALFPSNFSRFSLGPIDIFHGIAVVEFLIEKARERHLWTGRYPENMRVSHFRDRCTLM